MRPFEAAGIPTTPKLKRCSWRSTAPPRLALHDHVDGTHFSIEAYGEYLVIDTGYYKPNELNNARTANAPAHNVILVDRAERSLPGYSTIGVERTPYLRASLRDDQRLAYAEAHQRYEATVLYTWLLSAALFVLSGSPQGRCANQDPNVPVAPACRSRSAILRDLRGLQGNRATLRPDQAGSDVALGSTEGEVAFEAPPFEEDQAPYVHSINGHGHHDVLDGVLPARQPQPARAPFTLSRRRQQPHGLYAGVSAAVYGQWCTARRGSGDAVGERQDPRLLRSAGHPDVLQCGGPSWPPALAELALISGDCHGSSQAGSQAVVDGAGGGARRYKPFDLGACAHRGRDGALARLAAPDRARRGSYSWAFFSLRPAWAHGGKLSGMQTNLILRTATSPCARSTLGCSPRPKTASVEHVARHAHEPPV